jgi:hypothetical protein
VGTRKRSGERGATGAGERRPTHLGFFRASDFEAQAEFQLIDALLALINLPVFVVSIELVCRACRVSKAQQES